MELKEEIKANLNGIDDNEIILDNSSGIYNFKYILELIKVNCNLTRKEETEIDEIINDFNPSYIDIEQIFYIIEEFESIVDDELPDDFIIMFSENGDYGIFKEMN